MAKKNPQIPESFRNLRFDGYDLLPGKVADDGTLVASADDFVWLYRVACLLACALRNPRMYMLRKFRLTPAKQPTQS